MHEVCFLLVVCEFDTYERCDLHHVGFVGVGDIDCNEADECNNGNYTCNGSGCKIKCSGTYSCAQSTFECNESCKLVCDASRSCDSSKFYFNGGNVTIICKEPSSCDSSQFSAQNNTYLDITCNGQDVCSNSKLILKDTSTFTIDCSGQYTCQNVKCSCATSGCEKSGIISCN